MCIMFICSQKLQLTWVVAEAGHVVEEEAPGRCSGAYGVGEAPELDALLVTVLDTLRHRHIIIPALDVIERVCAEAITRANRRIYEALSEPLATAAVVLWNTVVTWISMTDKCWDDVFRTFRSCQSRLNAS